MEGIHLEEVIDKINQMVRAKRFDNYTRLRRPMDELIRFSKRRTTQQDEGAVSPVIATILMVAITVVLSGVIYVWAQELSNNQTELGTLNSYDVEAAVSGISSGTTDNLVRMSFVNGEDDLQWSFITITLYKGDITYNCNNKGSSDCFAFESNPDAAWNGNEVLLLKENDAQICDDSTPTCDIKVTVSYKGKAVAGNSNEISLAATSDESGIGSSSPLIITAIFDCPLSGGMPKGIELYVIEDIPDLNRYGIGTANNGGGSDGMEYSFPEGSSASAGDYIYVSRDDAKFTEFFGFSPDYIGGNSVYFNGDDAVELFIDGIEVIDVFGDIDTDGSGESWEYTDGWAYRNSGVGANNGNFILNDFTYSGINALDGESSNDAAATPVPIGTWA